MKRKLLLGVVLWLLCILCNIVVTRAMDAQIGNVTPEGGTVTNITTPAQQTSQTEGQGSSAQQTSSSDTPEVTGCDWIKLNTNFPIIWNCIGDSPNEDETNAFPTMIWAITKIIISLILVVCFILIIVAGIMWAADKPKEWKDLLKKVAITILLLWFSWAILRLINPNFFS